MNNDQRSGDLFAPETVDERIEQLLQAPSSQEQTKDVQLVRELYSIYQEDASILAHARERLFQHEPETKDPPSPAQTPHDHYERSYSMNSLVDIFSPKKRSPIQRVHLLVAGLVAALLVGSLLAVLALVHQAQTNAAGTPHQVMPQPTPGPRTAQEISTRAPGPWGIALDEARGFVYVAEPGCDPEPPCPSTFPTQIGQHSLIDGHFIRAFKQPAGYSSPFFVVVNPADGHVWFTEPNSDAIGELNPTTGKWAQYKLKRGIIPYDLVLDKHGFLWFTGYGDNSIGFFNTKMPDGVMEVQTQTANTHPYGLTLDSRGNVWFAENGKGVSRIGVIEVVRTRNGKDIGMISTRDYLIDPTLRSQPHLITAAPNGHIWFSDGFLGNISEFDPATRTTTHYRVSAPCRRPPDNCTHISGIAADRQGNIWFTDSLNATVGYYNPSQKVEKVQKLNDPNSHPHDGLVIQSDGTVWFTEQFGSLLQSDPVKGPALVMWPAGTLDNTTKNTIKQPAVQVTPVAPTPTLMPAIQPTPQK